MKLNKKQVVLKADQVRELKWFCQNVVGTRQEFYALFDKVLDFKQKIDRLNVTCKNVEKFLKEIGEDSEIKPFESPFEDKTHNEAMQISQEET